jgi:uncharacterized membrane protein
MIISKLNIVLLAAVAGGVLWIERSHHIKIEASTPAEVTTRAPALCPENESVPFSADCMAFIQGSVGSVVRRSINAADALSAESPELP